MNEFIRVITEIKPQNDSNFAIADVNNLRGGYIQVNTIREMLDFKLTNKLKEGMLCYSKEILDGNHMFQFIGNDWIPWIVQGGGGGSGGAGVKVVDTLAELDNIELKHKGQIVFVIETDDLRWFNGAHWKTFNKIYIQPVPPNDTGGIWIDTSDSVGFDSNSMIQSLLQAVSVLQNQVNQMRFAFNSQLDFGDVTNNKLTTEYVGIPGTKPEYGTSEEVDNLVQSGFLENGISLNTKPTQYDSAIPNAKHLTIKGGTYKLMMENEKYFLPKELIWCTDRKELWIKDPETYKMYKIGSTGTVDPPIDEKMEGILTELLDGKNKIIGIEFVDLLNKQNTYTLCVEDGQCKIKDKRLDTYMLAGNAQTAATAGYYKNIYFPIPPAESGNTGSPRIFINMLYCGDKNDKYSYCPVSHNFIELSNVSNKDINLKGMFLHYTEGSTGKWITLPLKGVIKSGNTFLIKGSQCSVEAINTTLIKVGEPDMYWHKDLTYHNTLLEVTADEQAGVEGSTVWGDDNLLRLSYNSSLFLSGGENDENTFKIEPFSHFAPYSNKTVIKWYIDLFGVGVNDKGQNMQSEVAPFAAKGKNVLITRYFTMDNVSQATKAIDARSNANDFIYIDLDKLNPKIDIKEYTPKNSKEGKNIFFNKPTLLEGKPNIITCSLGYNSHTTRCFSWISTGYYDEFIKVWKTNEGESAAVTHESFKEGDSRPATKNRDHYIYNRIRSITTDKIPFTVHKIILDFPEPATIQEYSYVVGKEGAWSEVRKFTLRGRDHQIAQGVNALHISDQQGFNSEEYETWRVCAEHINAKKAANEIKYDFSINTGDATQNGNRIGEWLDYFNAGESIFNNTEQMYVVGNNDLCPLDVYSLGDGSEISKTNPINVQYFFTFEHPFEVPLSQAGVYIPSLYSFIVGNTYYLAMNSEITNLARTDLFKDPEGVNVYNTIQGWCERDLQHINTDSKIKWRTAFCHESPFTIIIQNLILSYAVATGVDGEFTINPEIQRGGGRLNTVGAYWFSQFLQDNSFKLCLCGHKHTYCNSRYLRDDPAKTMEPYIYEPQLEQAPWYTAMAKDFYRERACCRLTADKTKNYVRYVMCQATGFKLGSNKELPARAIPWLQDFYPAKQVINSGTNTATSTANAAQSFPHYIIWNIGTGNEGESSNVSSSRDRILGKAYKIQRKDNSSTWAYKYNVPIAHTELHSVGGNGDIRANDNIIIEHQL